MDSQKIHIDKNDDLAIVSQQVFSSDADRVILVVPKFSKIAETADDLKFLKKGLSKTDKELIIESVDDNIISLAKKAKIEAYNPFFVRQAEASDSFAVPETKKVMREDDNKNEVDNEEVDDNMSEKDEDRSMGVSRNDLDEDVRSDREDAFDVAEREMDASFEQNHVPNKKKSFRPVSSKSGVSYAKIRNSILAGGIILGSLAWLGLRVLPEAQIHITTKKISWNFDREIIVDKSAVLADVALLKIPGQIFSQARNNQGWYPAKEKRTLNEKARGTITIYNNYSTQPQALVANTRFQTLDGNIVRLEKPVTVPPANRIGGKIVASSIDATVIADKPGKEYNIGPVPTLTIPGFSDSPDKFKGFYGEIKKPMTGGFIGEKTYPSDVEVKKAQEDNMKKVTSALTSVLDAHVPNDFIILDGAQKIRTVKEEVNKDTNDKGEFSVYSEAEIEVIGFREKDVLAAIQQIMRDDLKKEDFEIKSQDIAYAVKGIDSEKSTLTIQVTYNAVVTDQLLASDIRKKIAGKPEGDLKALMHSIVGVGLEGAEISLLPFWVSSVPDNEEKIKIDID